MYIDATVVLLMACCCLACVLVDPGKEGANLTLLVLLRPCHSQGVLLLRV